MNGIYLPMAYLAQQNEIRWYPSIKGGGNRMKQCAHRVRDLPGSHGNMPVTRPHKATKQETNVKP